MMNDDKGLGASADADRVGGLRPEPTASSQPSGRSPTGARALARDLEAADEITLCEQPLGHLALCREAATRLRLLADLAASIEPLIIHRWTGDHRDAPDGFIDMMFNSDPRDRAKWRRFLRARAALSKARGA